MATRTVVVTGASAGIGRATALAFAAQGCNLVICARAGEPLREVEEACRARGGQAVAVEADVSQAEDVERLGRRAVEAFGGFDVWVNNAGVTAFGRIDETPLADHEQVIRTNLCGCLFGAAVAVRHFRERGAGTLINVSSIVSRLGQALSSAYTASKWGITGLGEALRAELAGESRVHVCTVMPTYIDTQIFQHAANYAGRPAKPVSPVYSPERVAEAILDLVERPRPEVVVGDAGRVLRASHALMPELTNRLLAAAMPRTQFLDRPQAPGSGNLHAPAGDDAVSGGWRGRGAIGGDGLDTALRGVAIGALALAGAVAAAGLARARR